MLTGLHMRGAPVWTQYIAISTVHDTPKQCEHVLSYYFVAVTWDVTVTYIIYITVSYFLTAKFT